MVLKKLSVSLLVRVVLLLFFLAVRSPIFSCPSGDCYDCTGKHLPVLATLVFSLCDTVASCVATDNTASRGWRYASAIFSGLTACSRSGIPGSYIIRAIESIREDQGSSVDEILAAVHQEEKAGGTMLRDRISTITKGAIKKATQETTKRLKSISWDTLFWGLSSTNIAAALVEAYKNDDDDWRRGMEWVSAGISLCMAGYSLKTMYDFGYFSCKKRETLLPVSATLERNSDD